MISTIALHAALSLTLKTSVMARELVPGTAVELRIGDSTQTIPSQSSYQGRMGFSFDLSSGCELALVEKTGTGSSATYSLSIGQVAANGIAAMKTLVSGRSAITAPRFSPAGERVGFVDGTSIHVIDLSTGREHTVAPGTHFAWTTDGAVSTYRAVAKDGQTCQETYFSRPPSWHATRTDRRCEFRYFVPIDSGVMRGTGTWLLLDTSFKIAGMLGDKAPAYKGKGPIETIPGAVACAEGMDLNWVGAGPGLSMSKIDQELAAANFPVCHATRNLRNALKQWPLSPSASIVKMQVCQLPSRQ